MLRQVNGWLLPVRAVSELDPSLGLFPAPLGTMGPHHRLFSGVSTSRSERLSQQTYVLPASNLNLDTYFHKDTAI